MQVVQYISTASNQLKGAVVAKHSEMLSLTPRMLSLKRPHSSAFIQASNAACIDEEEQVGSLAISEENAPGVAPENCILSS